MTRRDSENGFTLLEVLVASMLMAMLITILTMVFNSSSIAWSTGKAGVAEMDKVRNNMAVAGMVADNAVPGAERGNEQKWGVLVGPWKSNGDIRHRAIEKFSSENVLVNKASSQMTMPTVQRKGTWVYDSGRLWTEVNVENFSSPAGAKAYVVGVWSYGPDGTPDSGDDISTWPDMD